MKKDKNSMKYNLDVKKMFDGKKILFVKAQDLVNFQSKLVEGTRITAIVPADEYFKINVKIIGKPLSAFAHLQPDMIVEFKDLQGVPYLANGGRIEASFSATDVVVVKDNNKAASLPNLN